VGRISLVLRDTIIWLVSTVLMPLSLVICLVLLKRANFQSAVSHGELLTVGASIAGASIALEMIMAPGSLLTTIYQCGLLSVLFGDVFFFAGNADVTSHVVEMSLSAGEVQMSVNLLIAAILLGLCGVARQSRQLHSRDTGNPAMPT
jgi:hypothetical protein